MTRRTYAPAITDERPGLNQDREFIRFLQERLADEQRESDRLQNDIETLLAQVDVKRAEQTERLNIVAACAAGIAIHDKDTRPAPQLTPHTATAAIAAVLDEISGKKEEQQS